MRGTQQAAGWRVSFGRQATLRGCDGACALSVGATDSVRGATDSGQSALPMLGVGQCALSPFSAAAVFPRILRSPALLALRVLLPLLLIQLDRFHHGLSGMAELRDVSRYRGEFFQLIACRQRTSLGALGGTLQNSLFFRQRSRSAGAAARVVRSSSILAHTGGRERSRVQRLERRGRIEKHDRRGAAAACLEH